MPDTFESALAQALDNPQGSMAPWLADGDLIPLDVYRNTIARGWILALKGLFPSVEKLVGEDWFSDAALIFARNHPPSSPVLDDYGLDFPDWLVTFPPASELAYLAPIARLDLAWSRAHRAKDAPVLNPDALRVLAKGSHAGARLHLHPSVCLFNFDWTVPSIWLANREVPGARGEPVWDRQREALAIFRPEWTVQARRLDDAEWLFLEGCQRGQTLAQALGRALGPGMLAAVGTRPRADPSRLISGLVQAGLFTKLEL